MKILLVEDDQDLAASLVKGLTCKRYQVDWVSGGEAGLALTQLKAYDLILLDFYLPKLNGLELCRKIRRGSEQVTDAELNQEIPILVLTGESSTAQKVLCLDAGADDYVVKPVDLDELMARIRALLRRGMGQRSPLLKWGELLLDPSNYEVKFRDQVVPLTSKEYGVLELLLRHPTQVFSPSHVVDRLWSGDDSRADATVRFYIQTLRQKLKQVGAEEFIETKHGLGYRLKPLGR
ncbi:response regulator transcription factor [Pantanalinema rosaneae CENA516]|uniref:response regulator transcription factor n=1 Tax=Pantanalinema rosaneae TaxID=1620701 RepID=UPI003D6FFC6C